jgi:hypothetical protein
MGEGWSDWIALMMQIKPGDFGGDKRGIGTLFLHKLQMGIRDFQYSTDRAKPMTYALQQLSNYRC